MFLAWIINSLVVMTVVLVHYEMLRQLFMLIPRLPVTRQLRVVVAVFGALIARR